MDNDAPPAPLERAPYSAPQLQPLGMSQADGKYTASVEFTNFYSTFTVGPS